ncbi:MAG: hypothetical protein GY804_09595 [Alphaproteobacteria bacterium]|nr:hypothetical protein [Alphaproteobacteria bacterium]
MGPRNKRPRPSETPDSQQSPNPFVNNNHFSVKQRLYALEQGQVNLEQGQKVLNYRMNEVEKNVRANDSRIYYAKKTEGVLIDMQIKTILTEGLGLSVIESDRLYNATRRHDRQKDGSIVVTWGSLADKGIVHSLKKDKLPVFDNPWWPEKRISITHNYSKDQHGESVRRKSVAKRMIECGEFDTIDMVGFDLISINGEEAIHYSKC